MSLLPLTRSPARAAPETELAKGLSFSHGRVHELCGPARRTLAVRLMAQHRGPVLWFLPVWSKERVTAQGLAPWLNPARIVFVETEREDDMFWGLEEALRSGAAPVIVAEVETPPALTPIRRLHLAAEAGTGKGTAPLILLLSPEDGGAQGVEPRWHMGPAHNAPRKERWALSRLRARLAPPANFTLNAAHDQMAMTEGPPQDIPWAITPLDAAHQPSTAQQPLASQAV